MYVKVYIQILARLLVLSVQKKKLYKLLLCELRRWIPCSSSHWRWKGSCAVRTSVLRYRTHWSHQYVSSCSTVMGRKATRNGRWRLVWKNHISLQYELGWLSQCSVWLQVGWPGTTLLSSMVVVLYNPYLGSFEKLQELNVGFIMSVCPSTWNSLAPTGQILMNFYIWVFFENFLRKFRFH